MNDYENGGFGSGRQDGNEASEHSGGEYSFKKEQVPFGTYDEQHVRPSAYEAGEQRENQSQSGREREDDGRGYVDANYRPRESGSQFSYGSYYTPPQKPKRKKDKKSTKEKGGFSMVKLVCACLVCALLGGLGGGAIVASQIPENSHVAGSINTVTNQPVSTPNITKVADGSVLTGNEIYALGCEQVVGVTTEISQRSYFGFGMEYKSNVTGSGFIVTENGYIVTNYHVVADAYNNGYEVTVLLYNGDVYPAKIVGVRDEFDLAVLKIDASGLSAATLGDSSSLQVGDAAYAIGNPLGELNFTMTTGHISALDRNIATTDSTTQKTTTNVMFQIDAAINRGNSGGPVYNDRGEVVGIVTAKYADTGVEGLGFAIPINSVVELIDQFVEVGYVSGMASFGIMVEPLDAAVTNYFNMPMGAYVRSVNEGSCSEKAGMKAGDIITDLNGTEISSRDDLLNAKKNYRAGDTVTVTVYRDGEYLKLELTFDEEPITVKKANSKPQDSDSLPVVPKAG